MDNNQKYSEALDRVQNFQSSEADMRLVSIVFANYIRDAYPDLKQNPELMYRIGGHFQSWARNQEMVTA